MFEFFDYIKKVNIKIKFLSNDIFAGEYTSAFKGRGLEFEEIREYIAGDDVKTVDWNNSAKTGKLHTKIFKEERELTVIIILDISASMYFGSKWAFKSDIATEVSALLAYTAVKSNDKVGAILFGRGIKKFIPPKKGRTHIWNIIKTVVEAEKRDKTSDISTALKFLGDTIKKRGVVFLISDFISDDNFYIHLKSLKKKFDIVPVIITDPYEGNFRSSSKNIFNFEDSESALFCQNRLDFSPKHSETVTNKFKNIDIHPISITTDKPYINEIAKYFKERGK